MKLRLIYPRFKKFLEEHPALRESLKDYIVGDYTMPPSLALPIIAAMTPEDIEVNLTDDNVGQTIDYDENIDLVAISCFTPQAERAYEIADEFRRHGKKVVIGGMHPSSIPEEALEHADSVCVGEAEPVWLEILEDVKNGGLKKKYTPKEHFNLADLPIPRREIFTGKEYSWNAHHVCTMRGCPVKCAACPVPNKEGALFRFRPVDNIIEDIKKMPYNEFYIIEDMITLPGKRSRKFLDQVMERTSELDISVFLSATMAMMDYDYSFYTKLKKGNVTSMYTVFGFDTVSQLLFSKDCPKKEWQKNVDIVKMIEDNDIHFFASYGVGFDDQDKGVFERILRFSEETGIDLAEFFIATPFPGTPFGDLAEKENRIIHRDYSLWNQANVVFKPNHFKEEELLEGYYYLWEHFYLNKNYKDTTRSFDLSKSAH